VRDSCKRHLKDLKRPKRDNLNWDVEAVAHAIGFFEDMICLNTGEFEGEPFKLLPWQCFVVGSIFGWKWRDTGYRRFRVAFVETGKGSGKTPLAGGIGLKMLCADGESRAEIYSAAYNERQARLVFENAVAMILYSPELLEALSIGGGETPNNIAYRRNGSFFRPISSERQGRGKSGPIPHCSICDEVHEHPTNATIEFLTAGTKHRKQPLTFLITNSGHDRRTVCWDYHQVAIKVARDNPEDRNDSFFSYVCALDKGDDPLNDESCWIKANPSLPLVPGIEYLREQVSAARGMPSKENLVLRLNFCVWTDAADAWITSDVWFSVQDELNLDDYEDVPAYGGLDLSISSDLTSFVLAFEVGHKTWDVFAWFWMPGDRVIELQIKDNMDPYYADWRDAGHLRAPPGKIIDYEDAALLLEEVCARFDVRAIAYDRAKLELLQKELDELGCNLPLIEHGQGFYKSSKTGLWMPASIEETEAAITEKRIRIHENPVLTWNVASAVTVASSINPDDRRFDKRKASGRIDGAVALVEAIGAAAAGIQHSDTVITYKSGQLYAR